MFAHGCHGIIIPGSVTCVEQGSVGVREVCVLKDIVC